MDDNNSLIFSADCDHGKKSFTDSNNKMTVGSIYFHGTLEKKMGYDIAYCNKLRPPLGVYQVKILNYGNAMAHIWEAKYGMKGLIVDLDDEESRTAAVKAYLNKDVSI